MKKINVAEAKANLSRYLKLVESGETIILARHNKPVAEIRPVVKTRSDPRPFGLCAGEFVVPDDFIDDEAIPARGRIQARYS